MRRGLNIVLALAVLVNIVPLVYVLAYVMGFHYLSIQLTNTYKYMLDSLAYYIVKILPEFLHRLGLM